MLVTNQGYTKMFKGTEVLSDKIDGEVTQERLADGSKALTPTHLPIDKHPQNKTEGQQAVVTTDAGLQTTLRELGLSESPSPALKEALRMLVNQGVPLSKEAVQDVQLFLEKASGQEEQKLTSLAHLLQKNVPVTLDNLHAVHTALHGTNPVRIIGEQYQDVEQAQRSPLQTKQIVVERVTRKLAEAANQFQDIKREVTRNLDQVMRLTESSQQTSTQVKPTLEEVIDKLDKAISKSEMTMLTDMKTEKDLLKASAQLAEAKALLEKGDRQGAQKLVQEARATLERLNWKPSEQKVHHVLAGADPLEQVRQITGQQTTGQESTKQAGQTVLTGTEDRLVETVTNKATEANQHLQELKSELTRHLAQVEQLNQQADRHSISQARPILQHVIDAISRAMSHSGFTMLSDIETEKQLLTISMQLNEAKNLIARGENQAVQKIVQEVQEMLERLPLKLSSQKMYTAIQEQSTAGPQLTRLNQVQAQLNNGTTLDKVIPELRAALTTLPAHQTQDIQKTVAQAQFYSISGKEPVARQVLQQAVQQVMPMIKQELQSSPVSQTTELSSITSSSSQAHGTGDTKGSAEMLEQLSQKLAEASKQFQELHREITRGLDNLFRLTQQFGQQAVAQTKPMLQAMIDKIDVAILKSESTLFMDQTTEKEMLKVSSQLAEVRGLLEKGNTQQAQKVMEGLRGLWQRLNWTPSEQKVQHFFTRQEVIQQELSPAPILSLLTKSSAAFQYEPTVRNLFELLRGLGLQHEQEVAQQLTFQKDSTNQENMNRNLKALLLQLMREADGQKTQQSEQALQSIVGQQLLSRFDATNHTQHMFFQLPFLLDERKDSLKVFVQSRKPGEKMDWENCSIYFLMETKKMGEIGIHLTAVERQLSITIKNDMPQARALIQPLLEPCKERLEEIGYSVSRIQFTSLKPKEESAELPKAKKENEKKPSSAQSVPIVNAGGKKGFDFKI